MMIAHGAMVSSQGTKVGIGRARGATDLPNERCMLYLIEEIQLADHRSECSPRSRSSDLA